MIRGVIDDELRLILRVRLRGPRGAETTEEFVVDTGFGGALTLPMNVVGYLDLPYLSDIDFRLADGSVLALPAYDVKVEWAGEWRDATAVCSGPSILLGTELLEGHTLTVRFEPGGPFMIAPPP